MPTTPPLPPATAASSHTRLVVRPAGWSLPAALDREVAVTLGDEVVVMGGNRDGGPTAIVDAIDPTTGRSRRLGMLAAAEHDAAGAVLHGNATLIGGGAGTASDAVQMVSADGSTAVVGRLPHPRADVASVSAAGVVYVVGGYDGATLVPDVLATTDGVTFRPVAHLVVGVRYPAVAIVGRTLYVIGGATSGGENAGVDTAAVQAVSLTTGETTVVGHLPETLSHATAVQLDGRVYIVGGHVGGAWSDHVARFDPTTGSLRVVARLPRPVSDAAATTVRGTAYVLGGETAPNAPFADVVALSLQR